ncbi:MAG: hypothetical protein N2645_15400 [Clostridia bacterium]|nr:hypothetical protein [Clostridia bacterium]
MSLENLKTLLYNGSSNYLNIKNKAESNVFKWEWATEPLYYPQPLYFERNKMKPGKKLKGPPKDIELGMCQYGFDKDGCLLVIRKMSSIDDSYYENFFEYEDNCIYIYYFDCHKEKRLINVSIQSLENGRVKTFEILVPGGWLTETYVYNDNKVIRIGEEIKDEYESSSCIWDIKYDNKGLVKGITRLDGNLQENINREIDLQDLKPIDSVIEILVENIVKVIPDIVYDEVGNNSIYCVAIVFDLESNSVFPPLLGVGLQNEREQWVKELDIGEREIIWDPKEFQHFPIEISDQDTLKIVDELNRHIFDDIELIQNTSTKIIDKLTESIMGGKIKTTDDFIIYTTSIESDDYTEDVKNSIPTLKVLKLNSRKYL